MNKDASTNTFGVPIADVQEMIAKREAIKNAPAIARRQKRIRVRKIRTTLSRIVFTCISVLLLAPGCFFLYVAYLALNETGMMATIIPVTLGIIFTGGGIAGIISNVSGSNTPPNTP